MNREKRPLLKVMLLGDGGVGKSSLMLRFTDDQFIEQHMSTLGVDYKNRGVMINGRAVNLQIWDTAGQERFRTITRVYYRRTQGVLLVFDVTNRSSFENVEYWMGNLEEHAAPETEKILVGNKSDLSDARQVSTAEAVALAARFNVAFHETSAAVGSSVEDAFMDLAGKIDDRMRSVAALTGGGAGGGGPAGSSRTGSVPFAAGAPKHNSVQPAKGSCCAGGGMSGKARR